MTGFGIAVAFLLLLWCSLLFVPFRWRPAGIYLITWKALAVAYVPFIALIATGLAAVSAVYGSWWIAGPAGLAAVGARVAIYALERFLAVIGVTEPRAAAHA